ncbi:MAG: glycoside hydrolase family 127 protein, partial [Candidatus Aminicenantes bacterium]|nr:glycoside hydrolase family 127 protein [Candidatus Aminicenantes bacterium]
SLRLFPDPELEKKIDVIIAKIAKAQEPDGYLYTMRTINPKKLKVDWAGPERWSNLYMSHELYVLGHLYEAAVAWKQATGRDNLLDVAKKSFKLINIVFGPGRRRDVPGHQVIEIGLAKLFRLTGDKKYLDLAKFFLDERGRPEGHKLYGEYSQDHKPVTEQAEAVGHAVRATYMYSGMADVATLTGDPTYIQAVDRIWDDVAGKKMYITGGIGAAGGIEGFGPAYDLPNDTAYCETCAAIGHALWNHRMFLLHGESRYIDVLERILYNGLLSGISLSGDLFFYPNPLESFGQHGRTPWFTCACCPANVARLIPSIPGYVYAEKEDALYVNLFVQSQADLKVGDDKVAVRQETAYPWDGAVKIILNPEQSEEFTVNIRIPGWVLGRPVPTDLYSYLDGGGQPVTLTVNGEPVSLTLDKGYARLLRIWKKGDVIKLSLPMPVRRVVANSQVKADLGRIALERGPFVYCAEGIDNQGSVSNLVLPDQAVLQAVTRRDLLEGVVVLKGKADALFEGKSARPAAKAEQDFLAVPYYSWANRGPSKMEVWIAREPSVARPLPQPTIASRSKVTASGTRSAAGVLEWKVNK